jgi:hypothetical protein
MLSSLSTILILFISVAICGKVKLSLSIINYASCHEAVRKNGDIAPPFLTSALDGGELSALYPCCFTPEETAPITRRTPVLLWTLWRRENLFHLLRIKPRLLSCPDHTLVATPTELSQLQYKFWSSSLYTFVQLLITCRFERVLVMVYNTENYWVFGFCPSSDILKNAKEQVFQKQIQHFENILTQNLCEPFHSCLLRIAQC